MVHMEIWATDLHVCLRKHTISIHFCLEGLGFRVLGLGFGVLGFRV